MGRTPRIAPASLPPTAGAYRASNALTLADTAVPAAALRGDSSTPGRSSKSTDSSSATQSGYVRASGRERATRR